MSTKHAAEVKVLMDIFTAYNGTVSKGELLKELKAPKMRQVYDYLYWADREQGIVIKAVRTGREVTAYQHVSGAAQPVPPAAVKTVKPVKTKIKATTSVAVDSDPVVKVAKAAAKKVTTKAVKKAKVVKKTETKPVVEKSKKGEVPSYSVDPDFDANDPLAIPDFLKRQ
jgi:hypothetical protein